MSKRDDDRLLSDPDSKTGKLQRACLDLLREHDRAGDIPTNGRFLFYELEQRGVIPKNYAGVNPKTGEKWVRTPMQDVSVATMHLREVGLVRWDWIEDETRSLNEWSYAPTVLDAVIGEVNSARIDIWDGEEPPLIICESRATMGVLRDLTYQYLVPITATNGQSGGFTVTDIVPLLKAKRKVLYIGDFEKRGPADQIEANTKRYIEEHTGRIFSPDEWVKIALTQQQVSASCRLQGLAISKLDKRYKPARSYEAIECEALGQGVLVRLIRRQLDAMLPKPLPELRERERAERERVKAALIRLRRRLR